MLRGFLRRAVRAARPSAPPRPCGAAAVLLVAALAALAAPAGPRTAGAQAAPAAAAAAPASAPTSRADALVAAGDLAGARALLVSAVRAAPTDVELLWRLSRVALLQGDALAEGSPQQAQAYQGAFDLANQAVRANGRSADAYVRRAAAAGKVALSKGVLESAELVKGVRDDATRALALDPAPQTKAAAHYILGRTHAKLAETPRPLRMPLGLQWGTLADGITQLRQAVALRPDFVMYRLDLARALEREGKGAEARRELEQAARLPEQEPGDAARKREAAQLLAGMRG